MQEEIRRTTRDGSSSKVSDEENCTLAMKAKKGKSKKASHSGAKGKNQDMSKVKCFHCHQHGHYATNCPQKKKIRRLLDLQWERHWLLNSNWIFH